MNINNNINTNNNNINNNIIIIININNNNTNNNRMTPTTDKAMRQLSINNTQFITDYYNDIISFNNYNTAPLLGSLETPTVRTTDSTTNSSLESIGNLGKRDSTLALVEVVVQGVIFALTLLGNLVVLALVLSLSRKRRKEQLGRMYTMIGHLSVADLSVATLNQLPQLAWDITFRFQGGPWLCKMVTFGQVRSLFVDISDFIFDF